MSQLGTEPLTERHVVFDVMTSREMSDILKRNHKTIERHAREGKMPAHFRLGRWYFLKSELDEWLKAELQSTRPPYRVN